MLLSPYFPVTCNPSKAVTFPNIGVPYYIGVTQRVTYEQVQEGFKLDSASAVGEWRGLVPQLLEQNDTSHADRRSPFRRN